MYFNLFLLLEAVDDEDEEDLLLWTYKTCIFFFSYLSLVSDPWDEEVELVPLCESADESGRLEGRVLVADIDDGVYDKGGD